MVLTGELGGSSRIAVSSPFRVVTDDAIGDLTVAAVVQRDNAVVHVHWGLASNDSIFGHPGQVTADYGMVAAVQCEWSVGLTPVAFDFAHGAVPWSDDGAELASEFDIPLRLLPGGTPFHVSVTCFDPPVNRSIVGSTADALSFDTVPPDVDATAIVLSLVSTTAGGVVGAHASGTVYTACGTAGAAPRQQVAALSWALAGTADLANASLAVTWTGLARDTMAAIATYDVALLLDGVVVASVASCNHPCSSASFPASVVWVALHQVHDAVGGSAAPCISGPLTVSITATATSGMAATATSLPFVMDVTPPMSATTATVNGMNACSDIVVTMCDSNTATTSYCDPISFVAASSTSGDVAIAMQVLRVTTSSASPCFVDAEASKLVLQHRLVRVSDSGVATPRDAAGAAFMPLQLGTFASYPLSRSEIVGGAAYQSQLRACNEWGAYHTLPFVSCQLSFVD